MQTSQQVPGWELLPPQSAQDKFSLYKIPINENTHSSSTSLLVVPGIPRSFLSLSLILT